MNRSLWILVLTLSAPIASALGVVLAIIFTGNRLIGMAAGIPLGFIAYWCVFPYKFWRPMNWQRILLVVLVFILSWLLAIAFEVLNLKPFNDSYNEKNLIFQISFGPPIFFELITRFFIKPSMVHSDS